MKPRARDHAKMPLPRSAGSGPGVDGPIFLWNVVLHAGARLRRRARYARNMRCRSHGHARLLGLTRIRFERTVRRGATLEPIDLLGGS